MSEKYSKNIRERFTPNISETVFKYQMTESYTFITAFHFDFLTFKS